jgi:hypothetical protein
MTFSIRRIIMFVWTRRVQVTEKSDAGLAQSLDSAQNMRVCSFMKDGKNCDGFGDWTMYQCPRLFDSGVHILA